MEINLKEIPVRELVAGYADNGHEGGVVGYGGKLDIRPKYQREFVYNADQRNAVVDTLSKGFPLNVMYWADNGGGRCEVIDGQQRILSICQYHAGEFSVERDGNLSYFHTLTAAEQDKFLDYALMVYFCRGDERDKLNWFRTINIAGAKLTDQELRNAVYSGAWVTDAKRYFSKNGCAAQTAGGKYVSGAAIRQEILETAIRWISKGGIEDHMSKHQHDESAKPLWEYFEGVIDWVRATFPDYRSNMKGVQWGDLHREFGSAKLDSDKLKEEVSRLMADDDVTNKRGVYAYVLDGKEKHLNIRQFSVAQKSGAYERQGGKCANRKCPNSGEVIPMASMHGDHITPWSEGGPTTSENCQMLCAECNRRKSAK